LSIVYYGAGLGNLELEHSLVHGREPYVVHGFYLSPRRFTRQSSVKADGFLVGVIVRYWQGMVMGVYS